MKSTELRTGNYLQDAKGKLAPVEGLSKNKIKAYSGMVTEMPLKPIPLTEEWLLKFGFTLVDGWYRKNGLSLMNINNHYFRANFPICIDITSVHQLQNLYFALTGEELTINK